MARITPSPGESQIAQRTNKNAPNRGIFMNLVGCQGFEPRTE